MTRTRSLPVFLAVWTAASTLAYVVFVQWLAPAWAAILKGVTP